MCLCVEELQNGEKTNLKDLIQIDVFLSFFFRYLLYSEISSDFLTKNFNQSKGGGHRL